ncbi:globin domain-containing protein [Streptomyces sp. NPDC086080]|uniref:globin domain-containing protein n=1 Tax=Streptomyces sp. NPDC086080 TaxID=3365748 RepID=UPI0037D3D54F
MTTDYHSLLARQEAMRLRDRLRASAVHTAAHASSVTAAARLRALPAGPAEAEAIVRNVAQVTPFSALIEHLYDVLFERHPYLRKLFPGSMEFQRAHLGRAFRYLIENLHRPDEVTAFFTRLGRDHRRLGVLPVHYEMFEEALLEALQRQAGGRLGGDVTGAWLRMVGFAAEAMVRGAHDSLGEPPYWGATVTDHRRRRPDLAVLRLRPSAPYPCLPGQYARLQSPLLPQTWRPYTLVGVPGADGELEFHIRRTAPGGVSDALVTGTCVGDTLLLGPAQGTTTLNDDPARDVLIVAGGTGWATARALLEDLAARRIPGRSAHLFLGARTADDLYDEPALARLENRCPWLRVVRVAEDGSGGFEPGSVGAAVARHGDFSRHIAYVSGPSAMVTEVTRHLAALGLPADRVRHDPLADGPLAGLTS